MESIVRRIPSVYPMINKILLYGSKVRGDFVEESDIDILLITDYAPSRTLKFEIYDLIYELEVEYNVKDHATFKEEGGRCGKDKDRQDRLDHPCTSIKDRFTTHILYPTKNKVHAILSKNSINVEFLTSLAKRQ